MKKELIEKTIVYSLFVIILILCFNKASLLLIRKGNGYGTDVLNFYKQKNNSVNVLVLGSSHAYTAINPYLIEQETGLKTYDFCTQQQPIWITYYYFKEALKTQKPQYVILDVHMVVVGNKDYAEESVNRDALDKMKFSKNKIDAINTSVEKKEDRISYYFNIIKYHSRYKQLNPEDYKVAFLGKTQDNKGYKKLPKTDYVFVNKNINSSNIIKPYNKNLIYFNKIIDLAEENNINLVLIKTPTNYNEEETNKINKVNEIAYNRNIIFLNYIDNIDTLNLDYKNDFYDEGHLNEFGSIKLTNQLIKDANL